MKYAFGIVVEPGDDFELIKPGDSPPQKGNTVFVCASAFGKVRRLASGQSSCVFRMSLRQNLPEKRDKTPWIVDDESMLHGLYGHQPAAEPEEADQDWEDVVAEGDQIQDLLDDIIRLAEPTAEDRTAIRAAVAQKIDFIHEPDRATTECVRRLKECRAELKREHAQRVIAALEALKASLTPADLAEEDPEAVCEICGTGLELVDSGKTGEAAGETAAAS